MFVKTLDWLYKYYPEVIICLLIGFVIVFITWKIARLYFFRFCPIEKKVDGIVANMESIRKDITNIKNEIFSRIGKIEASLNRLSFFLIAKYPRERKELFNIQSPIELTDLAKELLETSGAKTFIDSSLDSLIAKIKEGQPKSDLDIQQLAVSIILNLVDTDGFTNIKDFIYQNPKYKGQHDIDIQLMINLSALYLRDRYLSQRENGNIIPANGVPN